MKKRTVVIKAGKEFGNVDRVISFRIESAVTDFLLKQGIDPTNTAREYLRDIAREEGLTGLNAPVRKGRK